MNAQLRHEPASDQGTDDGNGCVASTYATAGSGAA
jgi:hypothetical protein